jgi:hypothetical protein
MTKMTLFDYTMYIFDLVRDIGRQFRERQRTEFLAEKKATGGPSLVCINSGYLTVKLMDLHQALRLGTGIGWTVLDRNGERVKK